MSLRTARDVLVIPLVCLLYAVSAMTPTGAGEPSNRDALGTQIDDFTLRDFRGKAFRLSDHAEAKAVVIAVLGCECPLGKLYAPRLAELAAEYELCNHLVVNSGSVGGPSIPIGWSPRHRVPRR